MEDVCVRERCMCVLCKHNISLPFVMKTRQDQARNGRPHTLILTRASSRATGSEGSRRKKSSPHLPDPLSPFPPSTSCSRDIPGQSHAAGVREEERRKRWIPPRPDDDESLDMKERGRRRISQLYTLHPSPHLSPSTT